MITHADTIYDTMVKIGKQTTSTEIRQITGINTIQICESLRKLFKDGKVNKEYKYTGHQYRRGTMGLQRERRLFWSVK